MKTKILNILGAICLLFGIAACSDDNTSDLRLDGDCMVEALALDNYQGNIDLLSRTIIVRLPEVYETSAMKLTTLTLSNGAVCNISQGNDKPR